MLYFATLTAIFVVLMLVAESRGQTSSFSLFKLMASTAFVGCALAAGAGFDIYGRAILLALILSWLGDALLLSSSQTLFKAGILAFFAAHLAFGAAFLLVGMAATWLAGAGLLLAVAASIWGRRLRSRVPPPLRLPITSYILIISVMVALGAGAFGASGRPIFLIAPVAFYLSDLTVARQRFVQESFLNSLCGLPLYYGAQVLFALSTAPGGPL